MIRITPAQLWEAHYIASYLRPEDERECLASSGRKPADVVPEAFRLSKQCYSLRRLHEGAVLLNPCAIFGVCDDPQNLGWGLVWLLATTEMNLAARAFLRAAPMILDHLGQGYQYGVHTLVDSRNTTHVRWLKKNKFNVIGTYEHSSVPFLYTQRPNAGVSSV